VLAGEQIAAGAGVASCLPDLDFETYSEAGYVWDYEEEKWEALPGLSTQKKGLKGVGLYNYVRHPTFEVLSLAYDLKDGLGVRHWRPGLPDPADLLDYVRQGMPSLLEAWNAEFEVEVWHSYCVPKLGWPPLVQANVRCAMAKARAQSYPAALKEAGPALRLPPELLKDERGDKLVAKLTVPKKPTKKDTGLRWTRATAPDDFRALDEYCVQDVITESAASIRIKDLSERELEIWQTDQRINRRGMMIDVEGVEDCISIIEQAREKYNAEIRFITNGAVSGYTKAADMMAWFRTRGVTIYELDEETVELEIAKNHGDAGVRRILALRQLLSFGSVNKCFAIRAQVGADRRLRGQYAYHGAHTGLWNGQNVQVANLYKGALNTPAEVEFALAAIRTRRLEVVETLCGDALETVANCLRSLIVAPPGHDIISADYSAIQAVVTAALAGEDWRLEVFHTHGKIYEMCASLITGKPFQFYLDYRKQTGRHHEDRQPYGKIPELSAGFGSWINGWKKFGAGDFMTDDEIKRAILKWREASPAVVELWGGQTRSKFRHDERPELYGLEGAAIQAIKHPGQCFGYQGIRYQVHKGDLYCQPPTDGDPIIYHEIDLEPSTRDYARPWELQMSYRGWNSNQTKGNGGWVRMRLYGGVQTQNVVAKVSREVQANALVALDKTGLYVPVMHTHDENACEVPEGQGTIDEYLGIVNRLPSWAVSWDGKFAGRPWPIKAPGAERTKRYGRWE